MADWVSKIWVISELMLPDMDLEKTIAMNGAIVFYPLREPRDAVMRTKSLIINLCLMHIAQCLN